MRPTAKPTRPSWSLVYCSGMGAALGVVAAPRQLRKVLKQVFRKKADLVNE